MTVDAWMQHPTAKFLQNEMFESLRRWTGAAIPTGPLPIEVTIAAMDAAGVEVGMLTAWHAPEGPLLTNDEVAGFVAALVLGIRGTPVIVAVAAALAVMIVFSFALERIVLRAILGLRQQNRPLAALALFARHIDAAATLTQDAVRGRQR